MERKFFGEEPVVVVLLDFKPGMFEFAGCGCVKMPQEIAESRTGRGQMIKQGVPCENVKNPTLRFQGCGSGSGGAPGCRLGWWWLVTLVWGWGLVLSGWGGLCCFLGVRGGVLDLA